MIILNGKVITILIKKQCSAQKFELILKNSFNFIDS